MRCRKATLPSLRSDKLLDVALNCSIVENEDEPLSPDAALNCSIVENESLSADAYQQEPASVQRADWEALTKLGISHEVIPVRTAEELFGSTPLDRTNMINGFNKFMTDREVPNDNISPLLVQKLFTNICSFVGPEFLVVQTDPKFTINYNIRELSVQANYDVAAVDESRLPNLVTFADMKLAEHVPLVGKLLGQAFNNYSNGYIRHDHVESLGLFFGPSSCKIYFVKYPIACLDVVKGNPTSEWPTLPCVVQIRCLEVDLGNLKEIYLIVYNRMIHYLNTTVATGEHPEIKAVLQQAEQLTNELKNNDDLEKQDITNFLVELKNLIGRAKNWLTRWYRGSPELQPDLVSILLRAPNPESAGFALEGVAICCCPVLPKYIPNQVDLIPQEGQVVMHEPGDRKEERKDKFDAFFKHKTARFYRPPNSYGADLFRWVITEEGDGKQTHLLVVYAFKTSQSGSVSNARIKENQEQARRWLDAEFSPHEMHDTLNEIKKDLSNGKLKIVFVYVVLPPPIPFTETQVEETLDFEYKNTKGEVQSCEIPVTTYHIDNNNLEELGLPYDTTDAIRSVFNRGILTEAEAKIKHRKFKNTFSISSKCYELLVLLALIQFRNDLQ